MSFKDLDLSLKYGTSISDPLHEFYIPVLEQSVVYSRIAGYFSSSSLAIAARGIAGLIRNGGKMRLIASHHLTDQDLQVIKDTLVTPQQYVENIFLESMGELEDRFLQDHIKALGWMIQHDLLQIRLAFRTDSNGECLDSLFHQKIGIFFDKQGHSISFSGSINETASGWIHNVEEFKVFSGWVEGQNAYVEGDIQTFEEYWNNVRSNMSIIPVSEAVHRKLVSIGNSFDINELSLVKYFQKSRSSKLKKKISLFTYQQEAVSKWKSNGCRLLFEMATGTGKTRTALACVNELINENSKLVVIVASPQNTLSRQWESEVKSLGMHFDDSIIADGTNRTWRDDLRDDLRKISVQFYDTMIVYTTHDTYCSKDFIDIFSESNPKIPICFIGDEVHGLGAAVAKTGLIERYNYRIGLSATPRRWFDEIGTDLIVKYFGDCSFEFTIKDALTTINPLTNKFFLCDFNYYPVFIQLNDEELEKYVKLTNIITKLTSYSSKSDEYASAWENLIFGRADIVKSAQNKIDALRKVLGSIDNVKDTLIFSSPEQINEVVRLLDQNDIVAHRFTQNQGCKPSDRYNGLTERQHLIKCFKDGQYQVLVAITCLDEGIDIPSASTAIIMSSSTNPREYIQRIGRVIRQAENKPKATIFDFVIEPSLKRLLTKEFIKVEKKIFEKEMTRVKDMSSYSANNAEVNGLLNDKMEEILHGDQDNLY